jgi:hypothetical protein
MKVDTSHTPVILAPAKYIFLWKKKSGPQEEWEITAQFPI